MPVIGSSFVFSCARLHAGVMRRSDEALLDQMKRGISLPLCIAILLAFAFAFAFAFQWATAKAVNDTCTVLVCG